MNTKDFLGNSTEKLNCPKKAQEMKKTRHTHLNDSPRITLLCSGKSTMGSNADCLTLKSTLPTTVLRRITKHTAAYASTLL